MDFSTAIFGKNLESLTYQDIVDFFIIEHSESNNIEFKAFSSQYGNFNNNVKGVIRAICGFLNSDGGVVIWGAPLGVNDANGEKKFIGNLAPITEYKDKDWIINKVSDSVTPMPVGIKVSVLQNSPIENLYVFEIQPSPYKPHQTDNSYWVRLDGQTKPAPHYLIEALFKRISFPNIEGYLKFNRAIFQTSRRQYYVDFTIFLFNFSKFQNEENVIYRLNTYPGNFQSRLQSGEAHTYDAKEDMLHFGTPMMNNQRLILTNDEVLRNDYIVHIVLTIGGKNSPMKSSEYELNFRNFNSAHPDDLNGLVNIKSENLLLSDIQAQLGTTRESSLQTVLGRVP